MAYTISESDWRLFRQLRPIALERFCQRVLSDVEKLAQDGAKTGHDRYLAIYNLMQQRDRELSAIFDDPRRSMAIEQLARMCALDLLTDDEIAPFAPEPRAVIQFFAGRSKEVP
jgi:hypothetical protein